MDASSARVRVSPGRLKDLKKMISRLDREIQEIDYRIYRLEFFEPYLVAEGKASLKRLKKERAAMDSDRKNYRLEAKGYRPPF